MFELEEYSGFHDGYLTKFAEPSGGPTLDFYLSDSMQEMLDVDIRSEIENVVSNGDPDYSSIIGVPHSLDQALNSNSNTNNINTHITSNNHQHSSSGSSSLQSSSIISSSWYGSNSTGPSWSSSSNDFYADIGACVNPISVMPLISSSLIMHKSPKPNLNSNGLTRPPASPNTNESSKSHLTFSPAQMKINSNSIRHEQIMSHIPKQIVPISSAVTAATTAPATLATNSVLQRKSVASASAVESIKKDLVSELRRSSSDENVKSGTLSTNGILSNVTPTNTIQLAPGIGGLTFANSITYNKLKQQATAKSPLSSPNGGSMVSKRERGSSPLHTVTNGGQSVSKIIARNMAQSASGFTPKSIASAHSPLLNSGGGSSGSIGSPSSASSMSASSPSSHSSGYNGSFSAALTPLNGHHNLSTSSGNLGGTKSLQQKIKAPIIESEYPKPAYSYSCLIAMALKNSRSGSLPVSEIYRFMCEHFPYFNTAPSGWKNSVRHNLSLNKCFEKIEKPATNGNQRKGCLWAMNPDRIIKMDEEVQKWSRKDPAAIRNAMVFPENLEALERGEMKHGSLDEIEADSQSDIEDTSDLEEPEEIDETIVDSMFVEEDEEVVADDEMISNEIIVMNECSNEEDGVMPDNDELKHGMNNDLNDKDFIQLHNQQQQQRDFDIEVEDFYDSIDIEDDKEAVRRAINQSDIIELCPADLNVSSRSPKRARLDINYSIGPVGELEKHILQQRKLHQQHQQQQQQFKKFRFVQPQQQQQQQQHFIVQTIGNGNVTNATTMTATKTANIATIVTTANKNLSNKLNNINNNNNNNILTKKQVQHITTQYQQITAIPQHNRRKMQLVNRIA